MLFVCLFVCFFFFFFFFFLLLLFVFVFLLLFFFFFFFFFFLGGGGSFFYLFSGCCSGSSIRFDRNGPRREKTCLRGLRPSETQTSLLSYRDKLENWNSARSKYRYGTFQEANNKGADQSARMRRLACALVVRKPRRHVFSRGGPIIEVHLFSIPSFYCRSLVSSTHIWSWQLYTYSHQVWARIGLWSSCKYKCTCKCNATSDWLTSEICNIISCLVPYLLDFVYFENIIRSGVPNYSISCDTLSVSRHHYVMSLFIGWQVFYAASSRCIM